MLSLVSDTTDSHHFLQHIRAYSNTFSFVSLGVNIVHPSTSKGPPVFKIQGQLVHLIGSLLPCDETEAQFLQVYVTDNTIAARARQAARFSLRPSVVTSLEHVMASNPFARLFATARERLRHTSEPTLDLQLSLIEPRDCDLRRYNRPRAAEVGAILTGYDRTPTVPHIRELVIQQRNRQLRRLDVTHSSYQPLRFVFILPAGTRGWKPEMTKGRYMGFIDAPDPQYAEKSGL